MSEACGTIDPDAWVQSLIGVTDCQAGLLGAGGWQGLSGSTLFNILLSGLLTLAIARLGYRFMAGQVVPDDIVILLVHIGVVIALATSWQAYDRLIYRVAMDGPAEIAGELFPGAGIDAGNLPARLQNAYDTIAPPPEKAVASPTAAADPNGAQPGGMNAAENATVPESLAMQERRAAAGVMVVSGAGSWMAARLALALLLALGPFAFAASLFPASAGLFIGWLRAVIGTAMAGLAIPIAISIELQMLEGPVRGALRAGETEIAGLNTIIWSFTLVILGLLYAMHRLAGGLSVPLPLARTVQQNQAETQSGNAVTGPASISASHSQSHQRTQTAMPTAPSRSLGIVRAVEARERASTGSLQTTTAPALVFQAASAVGGRTIRRGSQIVDGARRTASDRGRLLSQRPEAQT